MYYLIKNQFKERTCTLVCIYHTPVYAKIICKRKLKKLVRPFDSGEEGGWEVDLEARCAFDYKPFHTLWLLHYMHVLNKTHQ